MTVLTLTDGDVCPTLGLGTWRLGESASVRPREVAALRLALELGYRLFDTAEMYGEGGAETVLGVAIAEALRAGTVTREELFIVSKVYPHNADRKGTVAACERSLRRLGLDHVDLYLLHWRGAHPLSETLAGFEALTSGKRIRHWGVSNFDGADLDELQAVPGAKACATNQVCFSLTERGAGFDLLPRMRANGMPLMAYCPIAQGQLAQDPVLAEVGARLGASAAQVALAWVLAQPGVLAIPKAAREAHLRDNLAAADLTLGADDLQAIDRRFPPPRHAVPLAMV